MWQKAHRVHMSLARVLLGLSCSGATLAQVPAEPKTLTSTTTPSVGQRTRAMQLGRQVVLKLKTRWHDGTTHLVMSPLVFLQRLAALVPRSRVQQARRPGSRRLRTALWHRIAHPTCKVAQARMPPHAPIRRAAAVRMPADPLCVEPHRPTIASTSAFKNRSTSSMKPIDGTSSSKAVIEAIW